MRYEITGDPLYKVKDLFFKLFLSKFDLLKLLNFAWQEIGTYFMDIVNSSHSYATGGTSVGEFW